jgi:hypothetical protein
MSKVIQFIARLEAALERRGGQEIDDLTDVRCEACGDLIHRYDGPVQGILCTRCLKNRRDLAYCGNTTPLTPEDTFQFSPYELPADSCLRVVSGSWFSKWP